MPTSIDNAAQAHELLSVSLARVLPASPERVFEAWTTPELICRWWGPKFVEGLEAQADVRPGGEFLVVMREDNGTVHRMGGVYTEVERPHLLCMEIRHRQLPGAAERPEGYLPTWLRIEISEHPDGAQLKLSHTGFLDAAIAARFDSGWSDSIDKLESRLFE